MNHTRSIHPGLRFPFERANRIGWRVAALGGGWRGPSLCSCHRFSPLPSMQSSTQPSIQPSMQSSIQSSSLPRP